MPDVRRIPACLSLLATALLFAPVARGAALQTLEQGTWETGRAMVGAPSAADSAATAYFNPAGMALLENPEITGGGMVVVGDLRFDSNSNTNVSGGSGGNQSGTSILPAGPFAVYPLNDDWALGISLTVPFAGVLDPDDDWPGRFVLQKMGLAVLRIGPAVSYRVNSWLSLGASVGFNYTNLSTYRLTTPTGGHLRISDADGWATTWGASVMLEPTDSTRIGIIYNSELNANNLGGDVTVRGPIAPGFAAGLDVKFRLPQSAAISVRQELGKALVVFADFAWVDFSEFESLALDGSGGAAVNIETNFRDTIAYGVAAEYALDPEWTLTAGISYASSPTSQNDRLLLLPFDRQVRYGTGVRYAVAEGFTVALSYEYLDLGSNKFTNKLGPATVSGKYGPSRAQFIALTLSKAF